MALKIPSLRSCHLVSTELGEWVMYILRALRFDIGPVCLFVHIIFYNFFFNLGFTSQSTTTMWWSDMPGTM